MAARSEPSRLSAFDNIRGLAAVAVVLLHATYAYSHWPMPGLVWPVPLDEPSTFANALFWGIEGCVMPLFFVLSGYFLTRSLRRQSPSATLSGRTRRLLLPMMTVGLTVLVIDLHVWVLGLITTGRATVDDYRRLKFSPEIQADLFGPAHLWYVEYLWLMCGLVCGAVWLGRWIRRPDRHGTNAVENEISSGWATAGIVGCIAVLTLVLTLRPQVVLGFQHGWVPNVAKFAHGICFLAIGMLWEASPSIGRFSRRFAPTFLMAAAGLFMLLLPVIEQAFVTGRATAADAFLGTLLALFAVVATFGVIGGGLRWLDRPIPTLSRLAAASFWIYIVHHPLVGLLQTTFRPIEVPASAKATVVAGVALALCVWSYSRFVENGPIARLLEGEWPWQAFRQPKTATLPLPAEATQRKAA